MRIIYTSEFSRLFKKLSKTAQIEAWKKEKIFRENPFDSRLKIHKLHGKLKDCFAFSISYSRRIIFEFNNTDSVYFLSIGSHHIYE